MRIIVTEFVSIDGIMDDPGGSEGSNHGAWQIPYMTSDAEAFKFNELKEADALLLGRTTYEEFAAAWPTIDMGEFSKRMNDLPKYVISSTLSEDDMEWNAECIDMNRIEELRAQSGGNLLVMGSNTLVSALAKYRLVDEYRIMVHPIILGDGKKLFEEAPLTELKLISTTTFESGAVLLAYEPHTKS